MRTLTTILLFMAISLSVFSQQKLPTNFVCGQQITDARDGHIYNTVQIGTQCWFKSNLNIGTMVQASVSMTDNSTIEKYCYNNLQSNCDVYGGLYQWNEMMNYNASAVKGICPGGWHVPSNDEFQILFNELGTIDEAGGKMKEEGILHYTGGADRPYSMNLFATNTSGFTALPGGMRWHNNAFYNWHRDANFWTATQASAGASYFAGTMYSVKNATNGEFYNYEGLSVRCIMDAKK